MAERLRIAVEGIVQGVGFRPFVYGLAGRLGVAGFVANGAGEVVIEAEADHGALEAFVDELQHRSPGRVDRLTARHVEACGELEFRIAESDLVQSGLAAIAPDVATCADCVDEILGTGRRRGYAFTSCATCGPRLTIVTAAPYDRARTTMAGFPLCDECRAEHDDPSDRRFHAQPIACPACGPRLEMPGEDGDPIELAAIILENGGIVAIKGLGGYHLACDATSNNAVAELRRRKQRDAKPFAVMVGSPAEALELAELDAEELALLISPARPITLVRKRVSSALSHGVAPGVGDLGLMLPYTPLHHLLLRRVSPLVMTSGNVSDEPIAFRDDDARTRLGPIADRFVTHDRPIHMRCEDSIARVIDGAPTILRRARGYAPAPMRIARPLARPTLALGGHLKSAFALGDGDIVFVSPHFGDLDELSAYQAFVDGIDHFCGLHRISPQLIVNDLHPDYATTRLAIQLARSRGWAQLEVQHHHAHFASALADNGITGRAIGVVFDGAGFGDDGAIWGGEILVGDCAQVRRAMHLAYVPQPGGDRAAEEPWRMAIAHLLAAGEWKPGSELISGRADGRRVDAVAELCRSGRAPMTSSIGRLFDAVAALVSSTAVNAFEGQAAMWLEAMARDADDTALYPIEIAPASAAGPAELCAAPIIRGVVGDLARRVEPAAIARRFHSTIVELAAQACERIARAESIDTVVLTGGVFQNAILARELPRRLERAGLRAHLQHRVPPNDGGLSLGQLAIAAARIRRCLMCLGVPGRVVDVVERDGMKFGRVDFGGVAREVCMAHVPDVQPGEYVLVHVGFALGKLDELEAKRVFELLRELDQLDDIGEPRDLEVSEPPAVARWKDGAA